MGRQANILGGVLLLYAGVLHLAVMDSSGWGLLLAPIALIILWKPIRKLCPECGERSRTVGLPDFLMLLSLTLGTQLVAQLSNLCLPEKTTAALPGLATFLYVCMFAPLGEELLFRGLLQRSIAPSNKKLALFGPAFLFALLHGNLVQLPYAFVLGIVLGYAAMQYGLFCAVALHILNNLLFGYGLPLLLAGVPNMYQTWALWACVVTFAIVSAAILAANCVKIYTWLREHRLQRSQLKAFFCAPAILAFMIMTMALLCF